MSRSCNASPLKRELQRERDFHDELHLVFTAPWQRQIVEERSRASYEALLWERLGGELLGKLIDLKGQLDASPHRALALAFLASSES